MKKTKFLTITVFVLLFSILLTSCSDKKAANVFDTVFNDDYEVNYEEYDTTGSISELVGYTYYKKYDNIVAFTNGAEKYPSYILYDLNTQKVIITLAEPEMNYEISSVKAGVIQIRSSYSYITSSSSGSVREFTAYDFAGNLLAKKKDDSSYSVYEAGDLVLFNGCVYKPDSNGKLEKLSGFDSYALPSYLDIDDYNDKYYYSYGAYDICIYDNDLTTVYSYQPPSYVKNVKCYALNDGKVFVKGDYPVDEFSDNYDYYVISDEGKTQKYNLYYALIDPEKGTQKELELDCYVEDIRSAYSYNSNTIDDPIYSDAFENIAVISPIIKKRIDSSNGAKDIVLMDNNAKLSSSLKFVEGQKPTLPQRIADNRYVLAMLDGSVALINEDGKVIEKLYNYRNCYGSYICTNDAVYDLDMNPIFHEKDADGNSVIGGTDDTVYVSENINGDVVYSSFRNGTKKEILRVTNDDSDTSFTNTAFGYRIIKNDKYFLYNNSGKALITLNENYHSVCNYQNTKLYSVTEQGHTTYFCIYK